jgi:hypothetical protein
MPGRATQAALTATALLWTGCYPKGGPSHEIDLVDLRPLVRAQPTAPAITLTQMDVSYEQARRTCEQRGERLPTALELVVLADMRPTTPGQAPMPRWSASPAASPSLAVALHEYDDSVGLVTRSLLGQALCVSPTASRRAVRVHAHSDGHGWDDRATGLRWGEPQREVRSFEEARRACSGRAQDGAPLRLPTRRELLSWTPAAASQSGEVTVLPFASNAGSWWTSSRPARRPELRWIVDLSTGQSSFSNSATKLPTWCVIDSSQGTASSPP